METAKCFLKNASAWVIVALFIALMFMCLTGRGVG